ncbi:putative lipid II flippase FtsW [Candidatus Dependentiae bacterium]|nr:putative lipid II flippase FtsW [Candidatus Dependentiae bacterium]MBU4386953.1 putative lipid II flippase FtsW [Candidatus Dependentiae bacterium]
MEYDHNEVKKDLRFLLIIVLALTLIGFIFIYSSSSVYAFEKFGSSFYFIKKQLLYLVPAIISFFIFAAVPQNSLKKFTPLLFFLSLILTTLTLVSNMGLKLHGSSRWLILGNFSLQPSEFLKLFLFLYIGYFIEKKKKKVKSLVHSYLPFLIILGITFLILLKQPDFGSVITIFSTALVLFFIANFNMIHLFSTVLLSIPAIIYLIYSKSYRLNRILIFLNPWADPKGSGFQIIQSLIAIGCGKFWGVGISNSSQKFFYLPMQHTDFIFPIIAEEVGFVGSLVIIALYLMFLYFGVRIALKLESDFAFFTTIGFVVLITIQAVINLMVSCGLLPTKGLGLPFISYGGSSLVAIFCMLGIIANFSNRN